MLLTITTFFASEFGKYIFLMLGILGYFFLLLGKDLFSKNSIRMILIGLLTFIPGRKETNYDTEFHIFFCMITIISIGAITHREKLMRPINEHVILVIAMMGINFALVQFEGKVITGETMFFVTILVGGIAFAVLPNKIMQRSMKIFLYVIFLLFLIGIGFYQFPEMVRFVLGHEIDPSVGFLALFLKGGLATYTIIQIVYLINLIPYRGKHERSRKPAIERVKKHANVMISKFGDHQITMPEAVAICLVTTVCIQANNMYKLIPDITLINLIFFVALFVCSTGKFATKQ